MKIRYNTYDNPEETSISIDCETEFERSVFENIFKDEGAFAMRYMGGISIKKMPKEIKKLLDKHFRDKKEE